MKDKKSPYCRCLLFSANALSRVINRMAEEEYALIGLAPSHAYILMAVIGNPGLQPCELCEMMMLTPSTVTRLIEKMESKGLVERNAEGKNTFIYPTKKGVSMEKKVQEAWNKVGERYCEKLGEEKSQQLTDLVYDAAIRL
jgi:DNA-binding MarR family transcriptional regulator